MAFPDEELEPEWDIHNISHIAAHGLVPEQVEEVYYGEGPFPTFAVQKTRKRPQRRPKLRYHLWETDSAGSFLEVIVAAYPERGVWRCVTARVMSESTRKAYLKKVRS
jgi:hypothetical protein